MLQNVHTILKKKKKDEEKNLVLQIKFKLKIQFYVNCCCCCCCFFQRKCFLVYLLNIINGEIMKVKTTHKKEIGFFLAESFVIKFQKMN